MDECHTYGEVLRVEATRRLVILCPRCLEIARRRSEEVGAIRFPISSQAKDNLRKANFIMSQPMVSGGGQSNLTHAARRRTRP
jgi:hypothetical protein